MAHGRLLWGTDDGRQYSTRTDILALREESKILGRRWDVLKVVTCLQSSLWASPHRPTQCSKTGLKMSDWKCEILTEPSNGQESYSGPQEQGYLPPFAFLMRAAAMEMEWKSTRP